MQSPVRGIKRLVVVCAIVWAAVPLPSLAAAGPVPTPPTITAGYYNALPAFDIVVYGQHFTPSRRADVLILESGSLQEHDVVTVTAQGTFTDTTTLPCDFHAHAITAYDRHSGQWSNQVVLGTTCPGTAR